MFIVLRIAVGASEYVRDRVFVLLAEHHRVNRLPPAQHGSTYRARLEHFETFTRALRHSGREEIVVVPAHADDGCNECSDDDCNEEQYQHVGIHSAFILTTATEACKVGRHSEVRRPNRGGTLLCRLFRVIIGR